MTVKMIFRELYLFSPHDKTAKRVEFKKGINVITSNQEDGTDRGKSVIMRSLYHTLGAESHFESKWDNKSKIYILKFAIDDVDYYLYRAVDLYKFFNGNRELQFMSTRSRDFAEKLLEFTGFSVMLPDRTNNKLEITPPVYNYLPFFLDQDYYDGSAYTSFKKLQMYENFKDSVLFYHLGIYDKEYFDLIRQKEKLTDLYGVHKERLDFLHAMQQDVEKKIGSGGYSSDLTELRKDVEVYRREYSDVLIKLNKSKAKLIDLRNSLFELQCLLQEMQKLSVSNEKEIHHLNQHICPECGSTITETVSLKSKRYNLGEDIVVVKNDLQIDIQAINEDIVMEESRYQLLLEQLNEYDKKVKFNNAQVNDIVRHRGLCEIRESIVSERKDVMERTDDEFARLEEIKKKVKKYNIKKKHIEEKYYELLISARMKFGLNEVEPDKFKKLTTNFCASGSNKNIATVIWYLTILKLRREFNADAIEFPVVFDSPNNVETDNEKKHALLKYILENTPTAQLILSSIGFEADEFGLVDANIITLENEKYQLLDAESYNRYAALMEELCDAK